MDWDKLIRSLVSLTPKEIWKLILSIPQTWKDTNEKIKRDHFTSLVQEEYLKVKNEKDSALIHVGLDGFKQHRIFSKLLENIRIVFNEDPQPYEIYYTKRLKSIRIVLVGIVFIFALALTVSQIDFKSANVFDNAPNQTYLFGDPSIIVVWGISVIGIGLLANISRGFYQGFSSPDAQVDWIADLYFSVTGETIRSDLRKRIRFELRKIVNEMYFSVSYSTNLEKVSGAGLEEGYDRLVEVDTAARSYVQRLISQMNHGSFGVAGPRGTGKTTLLHSIQEQEDINTIYVHVSAPVAYNAREYILYLYAEICRAVANRLDPLGKEQPHIGGKWSLRNFFRGVFRWEIILAAIIVATVVFYRSGFVMEYYQEVLKSYTIDADVLDTILKYNFLLVFAAFLILVLLFNFLGGAFKSVFLYWFPETKNKQATLKKTYNELQRIKYQQTLSDAKGGKLNLSIFEASSDQSSTFQEYEMSLPEVTSAYRKFIAEMAGRYRFIIAIDEMDKIENPLQAQAFLNDLKDILNLENCFYLVSVSENAMSAFELRGLPFRDAFDSTFDEVIHLSYIDLKQAREIISRRLINFPEPFLQLAYTLSGGLPRDLIRITRKMIMSLRKREIAHFRKWLDDREIAQSLQDNQPYKAFPPLELSSLAHDLLREDIVNKINAVRHQVQEKGLGIKAGTYMLAFDILETNISIDNLNKQGKSLIKSARGFTHKNGLTEIQALFYNLGVYMLYISTLLAFFTQPRTEYDFALASDNHINQLVTARQRIGLSSDYALILVNQFRKTFRMPVVKA